MSSSRLGIYALLASVYSAWFTIGVYALYLQLYAYYILGASNLLVGLLATIYFSVNAPISIASGYLMDRFGKARELFIGALLILALSIFITPLSRYPNYLLFIRALQGLSIAVIVPLSNLIGARLLGVGRGVGIVNMVSSIGFLSAGLLGGFLSGYLHYTGLFNVSGYIVLASLMLVIVSFPNIRASGERIKFSYISKLCRGIRVIYTAYFIRHLAAAGVWSLFSLFIFSLGGDNVFVGFAHAMNTLTQVILFKKIGEYSEGRGLTSFKYGILLTSIVFLGYYIAFNPYIVLPFQVLLGCAWVLLWSGANVYIIENTPKEFQGTALGFLNTVGSISWIFGSLLNGYISDIFNSYKVYILIAFLMTLLTYLILELIIRLKPGLIYC